MYYCVLGFGVHVKNMQDCCIGTYMAMWFTASVPLSSTLGISPNVITPQSPTPCYPFPNSPTPQQAPVCDGPLCPCALVVQQPLMSENRT